MRIAICFSGFARTYKKCMEAQFRYLLHSPSIYNYDIFISTWNKLGHASNWQHSIDLKDDLDIENITTIYSPKSIKIDNVEEKLGIKTTLPLESQVVPGIVPSRSLSMFYKIKQCNELRLAYEKSEGIQYDLVVRIRLDVILHEKLDWSSFCKNTLHVSHSDWLGVGDQGSHVINDTFGFGTPHVMNVYASTYDNVEVLCLAGYSYHPETILKANMDYHNIPVKKQNFISTIIR